MRLVRKRGMLSPHDQNRLQTVRLTQQGRCSSLLSPLTVLSGLEVSTLYKKQMVLSISIFFLRIAFFYKLINSYPLWFRRIPLSPPRGVVANLPIVLVNQTGRIFTRPGVLGWIQGDSRRSHLAFHAGCFPRQHLSLSACARISVSLLGQQLTIGGDR